MLASDFLFLGGRPGPLFTGTGGADVDEGSSAALSPGRMTFGGRPGGRWTGGAAAGFCRSFPGGGSCREPLSSAPPCSASELLLGSSACCTFGGLPRFFSVEKGCLTAKLLSAAAAAHPASMSPTPLPTLAAAAAARERRLGLERASSLEAMWKRSRSVSSTMLVRQRSIATRPLNPIPVYSLV